MWCPPLLHTRSQTIPQQALADERELEASLDPQPIRLLTVGIMGSGTDAHVELAIPLAKWLARKGYNLLTGGGGGVMRSASKAFVSVPGRHGRCIGVLAAAEDFRTPRVRHHSHACVCLCVCVGGRGKGRGCIVCLHLLTTFHTHTHTHTLAFVPATLPLHLVSVILFLSPCLLRLCSVWFDFGRRASQTHLLRSRL